MTFADFMVLLPMIVLAISILVVLLVITLARHHMVVFGLTLLGFLAALITLPFISPWLPREVNPLFIVDSYALFFLGLLLLESARCLLKRTSSQPLSEWLRCHIPCFFPWAQ